MDKVMVEIDPKLVKIARSPFYWIVASLQGVSITFAPLFLYWSGKGQFYHGYEWIVVPSCFAAIFVVGFFHILLGSAVIKELRKKQDSASS